MRGYELVRLLQKDWLVRQIFRGVFSSDTLPRLAKGTTHALIINLDEADGPGTHWVAVFINAFGGLTYFDSFGMPPFIPNIERFIKLNSRKVFFNTVPLQNFLSRTCGLWAIFFIERMSRGDSLHRLISCFNTDSTLKNDNRIKAMFKHRMRRNKVQFF